MLWSKWFTGIRDKIYAAQVKEDVPLGFRSQVFVMRVTGIWPTTNDSPWYKWLTIGFFFIVGFLAPLTLFVNVFYSNNIQEAIEHSFVALNFWATAIKAGVSLWRRNNLRHIFRIQANLMNASGSNVQRNDQVARMNYLVHIGFTVLYCSTMSGAVIQATLSKPEDAIFPSTAPLPYGFARRRSVYLAVLVYQILGGYGIIIWAGIKDSLFFAFINTVCGHVAQLKERLQSLGTDGDDVTFYRDLVECCKCYEDCISFAKSMDNILSLAFFAQFGSSSLVICSTVYLLSVSSPMDDIIKYVTVQVYLVCLVSQILVNCYLGSRLTAESDGITAAVYESRWMDRNARCKRVLQILVERSMRPMTIYAGGLFELSLPTFVKICKAAYSYFNMLTSLDA